MIIYLCFEANVNKLSLTSVYFPYFDFSNLFERLRVAPDNCRAFLDFAVILGLKRSIHDADNV
jgi:hypothetical protein